jgi:protein gp37
MQMSENTKIEWATHTFNPWEGCQKVGPGCDNCYAENRNARFAGGTAINWGAGAPRRRTSPANWRKPLAWNAAHAAFFAVHGHRQRVFCASLADVFDNAVDPQWRTDLFDLIMATPNLDWLLLTKRIGNVAAMLPSATSNREADCFADLWPHVWIGATIVSQEEADRDIPKLLSVPAAKRFLSMEPLLGPVEISKWLNPWTCSNCQHHGSESDSGPYKCADCDVESVYDESIGSDRCPDCGKDSNSNAVAASCPACGRSGDWEPDNGYKFDSEKQNIDWVIVGGESGPKARPMHPDWARSLRDQCTDAGVPFLLKQWGEWAPLDGMDMDLRARTEKNDWRRMSGTRGVARVGKKAAGRLLDGREWNEVSVDAANPLLQSNKP